jgi:hypothetical protein
MHDLQRRLILGFLVVPSALLVPVSITRGTVRHNGSSEERTAQRDDAKV